MNFLIFASFSDRVAARAARASVVAVERVLHVCVEGGVPEGVAT